MAGVVEATPSPACWALCARGDQTLYHLTGNSANAGLCPGCSALCQVLCVWDGCGIWEKSKKAGLPELEELQECGPDLKPLGQAGGEGLGGWGGGDGGG